MGARGDPFGPEKTLGDEMENGDDVMALKTGKDAVMAPDNGETGQLENETQLYDSPFNRSGELKMGTRGDPLGPEKTLGDEMENGGETGQPENETPQLYDSIGLGS